MSQIAANIITGFLGVGKTTAIRHLLANKPEHERWAILVNEFGEVGVDGAILSEQGALVKEVPGGCMCCVAGLPMTVGLNTLLAEQPDRILIEPTGLGHPKDIIGKLTQPPFDTTLSLGATITLVDPRCIDDVRYRENQNFHDQIALADVVVANKLDQCSEAQIATFYDYVAAFDGEKSLVTGVEQGALETAWLALPRHARQAHYHHHHNDAEPMTTLALDPDDTYTRKENQGQGYVSCGWLFAAHCCFPFDALYGLLSNINAQRIKAVVNTDEGFYAFNVANQVVTVTPMSIEYAESRIEVIDTDALPWDELESILLSFLTSSH
ncbi:GTP-binding protein [Salinivibrio kushneri]|uniref:GTP-binding protein n=1 Tax=Salinivibrio kushneri TaxID=1908198 RepID=A0AB36K4U2_9GAMM|nr:GTP-binding protein [Salinivibrio kushneri]OOE43132.1 GTP-binding protein [Salinivibrio kushneri]OOE47241.1 GTP-binding protein [Salinivibrio kushneri]